MFALILGAIGGWMFWITTQFLNGNSWYDWIVGLILDELIIAVELFSICMLMRAVFNSSWMDRMIDASSRKLVWAVVGIIGLFGSAFLILIFLNFLVYLGFFA